MIHYDDDKLLEFLLEILDDDQHQAILAHTRVCDSCRARLEKLKSEVSVLGRIAPQAGLPAFPRPRARVFVYSRILKIAALLMVGFLGGFAASKFMTPPPVNVTPSYADRAPLPDSLALFAVSDATALTSAP